MIPVFFILALEKSFEMFPRHNEVATISESFPLNLIISVPLTEITNCLLHYNASSNKISFLSQ